MKYSFNHIKEENIIPSMLYIYVVFIQINKVHFFYLRAITVCIVNAFLCLIRLLPDGQQITIRLLPDSHHIVTKLPLAYHQIATILLPDRY